MRTMSDTISGVKPKLHRNFYDCAETPVPRGFLDKNRRGCFCTFLVAEGTGDKGTFVLSENYLA